MCHNIQGVNALQYLVFSESKRTIVDSFLELSTERSTGDYSDIKNLRQVFRSLKVEYYVYKEVSHEAKSSLLTQCCKKLFIFCVYEYHVNHEKSGFSISIEQTGAIMTTAECRELGSCSRLKEGKITQNLISKN